MGDQEYNRMMFSMRKDATKRERRFMNPFDDLDRDEFQAVSKRRDQFDRKYHMLSSDSEHEDATRSDHNNDYSMEHIPEEQEHQPSSHPQRQIQPPHQEKHNPWTDIINAVSPDKEFSESSELSDTSAFEDDQSLTSQSAAPSKNPITSSTEIQQQRAQAELKLKKVVKAEKTAAAPTTKPQKTSAFMEDSIESLVNEINQAQRITQPIQQRMPHQRKQKVPKHTILTHSFQIGDPKIAMKMTSTIPAPVETAQPTSTNISRLPSNALLPQTQENKVLPTLAVTSVAATATMISDVRIPGAEAIPEVAPKPPLSNHMKKNSKKDLTVEKQQKPALLKLDQPYSLCGIEVDEAVTNAAADGLAISSHVLTVSPNSSPDKERRFEDGFEIQVPMSKRETKGIHALMPQRRSSMNQDVLRVKDSNRRVLSMHNAFAKTLLLDLKGSKSDMSSNLEVPAVNKKIVNDADIDDVDQPQMRRHRKNVSSFEVVKGQNFKIEPCLVPNQVVSEKKPEAEMSLEESIHVSECQAPKKQLRYEATMEDQLLLQTSPVLFNATNKHVEDQQAEFIKKQISMFKNNNLNYDQEKRMNFYKQLEKKNVTHDHVVQNSQPQEGCPACELQAFLKQDNVAKDKGNDQETVDPYKVFREVPMHVIESKFYLKQTSLLNELMDQESNDYDCDKKVFTLGSRFHGDLEPLRVYFFNRSDVWMDFELNLQSTSIIAFVKFILTSYKSLARMDQSLLHFPEQPQRYKIFPSEGESAKDIYLADTNIPELSDNMSMLEAIGECSACCLIEVEQSEDRSSTSSTSRGNMEDPDSGLREFQSVYSKYGEVVFKVDCKEKEFSTIIRLGKEKFVEDVFDMIQKKKKIDIDRRNYLIMGKVHETDEFTELDFKMPLLVLSNPILKISRRFYEDRVGGTLEEQADSQAFMLLNKSGAAGGGGGGGPHRARDDDDDEEDDDEFDDDYDDDDDDDDDMEGSRKSFGDSAAEMFIESSSRRKRKEKMAKKMIAVPLSSSELVRMQMYEEFEVTKVTYVNNEIYKESKRVIGIDEFNIYNRKVHPSLFSLSSIFCFLLPSTSKETKCPQKKIDDIKDMYIIENTTLLLQFNEKDRLKSWLLSNPNPDISKKMFQKLSYMRKTQEIRVS